MGPHCGKGHFCLLVQALGLAGSLWVTLLPWCHANGDNMGRLTWLVDKHGLVPELSPGLSRGWGGALAFEGLLQDMQLLIEFGQLLAFAGDLAHGMQHRGVVAPTK